MKKMMYKLESITINYDKKRKPLSAKQRADMKGNYRYFGAQSVIDYVNDYLFDGEYLLIAEDGENLKSNKQNIAQIVTGQFWLNNHAHIVQTSELCNIRYLGYWLNATDISGYITGSAQPKLSQANLNAIEIELPDRDIQDRIVSILAAFDEKIEVNNQINRNLAEQSQMILQSYMISKEYVLTPLSEIADIIDCLHSKKPQSDIEGRKQLIQLDNITNEGFLDLESYKYMISDDDYKFWIRKCEIQEGDCVITNVGRVGAVSQAPAGTHAAMGRNMTCIRLKKQCTWYSYIITVLLSEHMKYEISKNTDVGTIMNALNVKDIPKLLFPVFAEDEMLALESELKAVRGLIEVNYLENQRLSALRDTLLPKLMSGELDVSSLNI